MAAVEVTQRTLEAMAAFAVEYAGTALDLDVDLAAAGVEHLLKAVQPSK